ncbi:hypothetical protein GCM10023185_24340 [Hymenobacter saemangeumensis]|uniref:M23ase beta-sheet core domain-containing protein n=1 Tax=Hymenobacter saemangeumensis TaxID=1084522 RepID=A0ABP8IGU1_9BACT
MVLSSQFLPRIGRFFLLPLLLLVACGKQQTLQGLFQKQTPHQAYARLLRQAGLDRRPAGRAWLDAAEQALRDSLVVILPLAETGYFRPERPTASSYRYAVRAGEQIHVSLTLAPGSAARVFIDAFEVVQAQAPRPLASADTLQLEFRYHAKEDGQHLLRVQPELLAAGRYTLRLRREPSLSVFPVLGRSDAAVGSFWGAERDRGARRHEGIDIFAPRGTPVVAAAGGYITRTGITPLGGRVVWLADTEHGAHLYYAHLDRQLVQPGQRVQPGDTLGLVGSTGNAQGTQPHLHFGIYRAGQGAVDPFPAVRRPDVRPDVPQGTDQRGEYVRLRSAGALGRRPGDKPAARAAQLSKQLPLLVLGRQGTALRVETPDGRTGYVSVAAVLPAGSQPLQRLALKTPVELLARPLAAAAALAALPGRTPVAVLGQDREFSLLRGPGGEVGWAVI